MSRQYRRVFELIAGDPKHPESALKVNQNLRIKFIIEKTIRHTPNHAIVQIYNLDDDSIGRVRNEYTDITINAGYEDSKRVLFLGNIRRRWAFPDGVNLILEIRAADGDNDYRNVVVNAAYKKGVSDQQILRSISEKFVSTELGDISKISSAPRARGKVVTGTARDAIKRMAETLDLHWSIQDGVVQFVPFEGTLPDEAIVIRADTGMLRAPEVSDKGIKAWCLLNPALKCGGKVKLDNNELREKIRKTRDGKPGAKPHKEKALTRLHPDGVYRIDKITHRGDTREREWESEILCTALGAPISAERVVTEDE